MKGDTRVVDFTKCPRKNKAYGGANGNKISVIYDNDIYMLKFPPFPTRNEKLSYTNSCISEYIGCKIFEMVGIPVQKVVLGTFLVGEKNKVVVGCKDFTANGLVLQDFASLKNQIIYSERNGYGTELSDILNTFTEQTAIDPCQLEEHFWNVFIVDAFIGNWDRHNGNWGFLYNTLTDEIELAPIYDCGSSLYPQADETIMHKILSDRNEYNNRIYNIPLSAIHLNGKKINYFNYISSLENNECNKALKRLLPKINLETINNVIDDIQCIDELQKNFYKRMLAGRKELILDFSYKKLLQKEVEKDVKNSVEKKKSEKGPRL